MWHPAQERGEWKGQERNSVHFGTLYLEHGESFKAKAEKNEHNLMLTNRNSGSMMAFM